MTELTWKQEPDALARSRALSSGDGQSVSADAPRIPGYLLMEKIGEGHYGAVWKALDLNARFPVAIKVIRHSDGLDYALLRGEVEKLIALCDDHRIVSLREVGWDAEPPYFVMDYLEDSLEKRLHHGPLPVAEAVDLFSEIVAGLVHAHNKGILHCDLKPGNILLGHNGQPRIADFGQSRLSSQQIPALGTMFYMAPEQADLKGIPDSRWDVYALGAVLYCMLTGAPPHQSAESREKLTDADSAPNVLARYREILKKAPKPAEHRRVPGIDYGLVDIIDRCLERDPKRRYANAQVVHEALKRRATWQRQKPMLALGIALPLVFLFLMFWVFWGMITKARQQANRHLIEAAADSNRSFAAAFAGSVARQFDRRWRSLDALAQSPGLQRALKDWAASQPGERDPQRLHDELNRYLDQEKPGTYAAACFVTNSEGELAAFAPPSDARGFPTSEFKDFDFFGLQGIARADAEAFLSVPFHPVNESGQRSPHHALAFCVPVPDPDGATTCGWLGIIVRVGDFREIQYTNLATQQARERLAKDPNWIPQFAAIVDTRATEAKDAERAGLVLQHARHYLLGTTSPEDIQPAFLTGDSLRLLQSLVTEADQIVKEYGAKLNAAPEDDVLQRELNVQRTTVLADLYAKKENELAHAYVDPFAEHDKRWNAEDAGWVLSARPVVVQRPGSAILKRTGLVVIAQQRHDVVLAPAHNMASSMMAQAIPIFVVTAGFVMFVWLYGFMLLNPASRMTLSRRLGRWVGQGGTLASRTSLTGTGGNTPSQSVAKESGSP